MYKHTKSFLIMLIVFLCFGCAQNIKVYKNNVPVPDKIYNSQNIESGLNIELFLAEMKFKKQNGKEVLYPEKYLDINNTNEYNHVSKNSDYTSGKIKIQNPYELLYHVILVQTIQNPYGRFPNTTTISNLIHQGDDIKKILEINKKIENSPGSEVKYDILVKRGEYKSWCDSCNNSIFNIQTNYKITSNKGGDKRN